MTTTIKLNKRQVTKLKAALADPKALRKEASENQSAFWSRFGVTQSGGSRYESGRDIPTSTQMLMALAQLEWITKEQLEAVRAAVMAE